MSSTKSSSKISTPTTLSSTLARLPAKSETNEKTTGFTHFLSSTWINVSNITTSVVNLAFRAAPYASWAIDASWMIASSAVLLSLPIIVEIQREATVRVMQHQRELENQQIQVC